MRSIITSKGETASGAGSGRLKKPELTADWEMKLSDIAKGKLKQENFLTGIRKYTCEIVDEIKGGQGTFRHDNLTNKKCPNCGKRSACSQWKEQPKCWCARTGNADTERQYPGRPMRAVRNAISVWRCLKGKEENFVCQCGYKEKLSSFQARRKKRAQV